MLKYSLMIIYRVEKEAPFTLLTETVGRGPSEWKPYIFSLLEIPYLTNTRLLISSQSFGQANLALDSPLQLRQVNLALDSFSFSFRASESRQLNLSLHLGVTAISLGSHGHLSLMTWQSCLRLYSFGLWWPCCSFTSHLGHDAYRLGCNGHVHLHFI